MAGNIKYISYKELKDIIIDIAEKFEQEYPEIPWRKFKYNEKIENFTNYSGRICEENEVFSMEECGILITDEQADDEEWISKQHVQELMECVTCCGCPLAQRGVVGR